MDIRLFYTQSNQLTLGSIDAKLDGALISLGRELETAVLISLFTDGRASSEDRLPDFTDNRRGWWGDTFPIVESDKIGSLLWLLNREKQTAETKARAKEYCQNALAWMLEDGIAEKIDVTVDYPFLGVMAIGVTLHRPQVVTPENYKFQIKWDDLNPLDPDDIYPDVEEVFYIQMEDGFYLLQEDGQRLAI